MDKLYKELSQAFKMDLPIMDNGIWWNGLPGDLSNLPQHNPHWSQSFGNTSPLYTYDGHSGVDIAYNYRCPIVAPCKLWINLTIESTTGYGKHVRAYTEDKEIDGKTYFLELIFGHLDEIVISSGEWVEKGTLLGYGDSTGHSTGHHLHLEGKLWVKNNSGAELLFRNGYLNAFDMETYGEGRVEPTKWAHIPLIPQVRFTFNELAQLRQNKMKYVIVGQEQYLLDDNLKIAFNIADEQELAFLQQKGIGLEPTPINNVDDYDIVPLVRQSRLKDILGL